MLILGRKLGERVRIETPCGSFIWVTMGDRRVYADAPHCRMYNLDNGAIKIEFGSDVITTCYMEKTIHAASKTLMNRHGIGIDAPRDYMILREELICGHSSISP